jgi:hypothetical protein
MVMEAKHTNQQLQGLRSRFIAKGNSSANGCYVDHARGAVITDVEGTDYLDFAGGIAVMNVGHSHPTVVRAIKDQAEKFTHTCFKVVPYEAAVTLAGILCKVVPGDTPKAVMFANSGVEAVENAVKIARYHTRRPAIITFENAFHGRNLMGMTLTSKMMPYKYGLGPFAPEVYRMPYANCYRCPFNRTYPDCDRHCADHLDYFFINQVAADQTAAIIFEPIQGEGGFMVPPRDYFARLKSICDRHGILLIVPAEQIDGKAALMVDYEDRLTIFDTLILCRFYRDLYSWEELEKTVTMVVGRQITVDRLRALAGRIIDLTRRYNIREGLLPDMDRLPRRLTDEALPDGSAISAAEMDRLLGDYYRCRGWSAAGVPPVA